MKTGNILIIGASGQLGSVLVSKLRALYPNRIVVASDVKYDHTSEGVFELLDAMDMSMLENVIAKYQIKEIYHLAAILSAKGEAMPLQTWHMNMKLLLNVLEVSRRYDVDKVFFPSSIGVFGNQASKAFTSQYASLNPGTVYGMSKVAGELWAQYYHQTYGLDVRSIRYPGIIGHESMPGGGTTDYAVEIYHKAMAMEHYNCFLKKDTVLPMIYMEDAIRATIILMEAPDSAIKIRTSYNISGVSFAPEDVTNAIRKWYPDFEINYAPDYRQQIADSWPASIDDNNAQNDWGWEPSYGLEQITKAMFEGLHKRNQTLKVFA